jgi:hypothetical protein
VASVHEKRGERGRIKIYFSKSSRGGAIFSLKKLELKKTFPMKIHHKKGIFQNLGGGAKNHGAHAPSH